MKELKVCWISSGVSSFVAGYLSKNVDKYIYIDLKDQHPDSIRFIKDCEKALGKEIEIIKSKKYNDVEDAVYGAGCIAHNFFHPCTNYLKRRVRKEWEDEHKEYIITYVWGFDFEEKERADRTLNAMPQFFHEFPLIEYNLDKKSVHGFFENNFNFNRPAMYDLGYPNNNCIGCLRGGMGYWNKIRKDFPEVFEKRSLMEQELNQSILKDKGKPLFLKDLDPERGNFNLEVFPDCGVFCYLAGINNT